MDWSGLRLDTILSDIIVTLFIIAQRLSTVRMTDQVIDLRNGAIAAQGTPTKLMHSSGLYTDIYHHQWW